MIPAYIRIHDALKKKIDDGFWEISQRLPSEDARDNEFHRDCAFARQDPVISGGFLSA